MGRDRALYMREYRAGKKNAAGVAEIGESISIQWAVFEDRIAELEEEVRHLKAELAKRHSPEDVEQSRQRFNDAVRATFRPTFRPVPKPTQRKR